MAVQNSLAKKAQRYSLTAYLNNDAIKKQIAQVVGGKNGTRFIASVISAVQNNQELQKCTNSSILSAALLGESLQLSPSPQLGQYYMVPFYSSKTKETEAQFQLGYKGYIQLALRSGQYRKLNVLAIKEGELISYDPLNEEIEVRLIENEVERENAETVGYYAMFEYMNGFRKTLYWSKAKMEAHAEKYSMGYRAHKGFTFWEKDFDGMAYKTMLRQLISKWGIMSIDMMSALDSDMAVIRADGSKEYVDNEDVIEADAAVESKNAAKTQQDIIAQQDIAADPVPADPF